MNYTFSKLLSLLVFHGSFLGLSAQDAARPLKTIDEVINGIDSLLDDIDRSSVDQNPTEQAAPIKLFFASYFQPEFFR